VTGSVAIVVNGRTVKTVTLTTASKGKVSVTLSAFSKVGTATVKAVYKGNSTTAADSSASLKVKVSKR